jgi:hypothetical protein
LRGIDRHGTPSDASPVLHHLLTHLRRSLLGALHGLLGGVHLRRLPRGKRPCEIGRVSGDLGRRMDVISRDLGGRPHSFDADSGRWHDRCNRDRWHWTDGLGNNPARIRVRNDCLCFRQIPHGWDSDGHGRLGERRPQAILLDRKNGII